MNFSVQFKEWCTLNHTCTISQRAQCIHIYILKWQSIKLQYRVQSLERAVYARARSTCRTRALWTVIADASTLRIAIGGQLYSFDMIDHQHVDGGESLERFIRRTLRPHVSARVYDTRRRQDRERTTIVVVVGVAVRFDGSARARGASTSRDWQPRLWASRGILSE